MAANNEDVKGWSGIASIHRAAEKVYSRKQGFRCIRFPETQRYEEGRSVVAAPAFDVQSLGSLAGALYGLYALALFLEAEVLVAALIALGLCRLWFATTILGCEDEDGQ